MGRDILVDGYNVIRRNASFQALENQLTSQMNAPPAYHQRLVRHRQAVRARYGLNPPMGKDDDDREAPRRSKKKK